MIFGQLIPLIRCACGGCDDFIAAFTMHGRKKIPRRYKHGHNPLPYGEKHHNWKGGRVDHFGYVRVKCYGHPRAHRNYVFEHILVMEKYIGRYITIDEDVHHINGNKRDNRIENLQLLKHSQHTTISHAERRITKTMEMLFN